MRLMGLKCLDHKGTFESGSELLHSFSTDIFQQNTQSNWLLPWSCMGNGVTPPPNVCSSSASCFHDFF